MCAVLQPSGACVHPSSVLQFTLEEDCCKSFSISNSTRACGQAAEAGSTIAVAHLAAHHGGPFGSQLREDLRAFKAHGDHQGVDTVHLASYLTLLGYNVVVRCALGGQAIMGSGAANVEPGACFKNLRHEFLHVRCSSGEYEGLDFVVDPQFREQFSISQPTERYQRLWGQLPEEWVGTHARLLPLVQMMCAEMALSFQERGLAVPPWRRTPSMLSKWLPAKSRDIPMTSSTAAATAAAAAARVGSCSSSSAGSSSACSAGGAGSGPMAGAAALSSPRELLEGLQQQLENLAAQCQLQASPDGRALYPQAEECRGHSMSGAQVAFSAEALAAVLQHGQQQGQSQQQLGQPQQQLPLSENPFLPQHQVLAFALNTGQVPDSLLQPGEAAQGQDRQVRRQGSWGRLSGEELAVLVGASSSEMQVDTAAAAEGAAASLDFLLEPDSSSPGKAAAGAGAGVRPRSRSYLQLPDPMDTGAAVALSSGEVLSSGDMGVASAAATRAAAAPASQPGLSAGPGLTGPACPFSRSISGSMQGQGQQQQARAPAVRPPRSLLSIKLSSARSGSCSPSGASPTASREAGAMMEHGAQVLGLTGAGAGAAPAPVVVSMVSHPPVHRSQPATHKVKVGLSFNNGQPQAATTAAAAAAAPGKALQQLVQQQQQQLARRQLL